MEHRQDCGEEEVGRGRVFCALTGIFLSVWVQQFSHRRLGTERKGVSLFQGPDLFGFAFSLVFLLTRNSHMWLTGSWVLQGRHTCILSTLMTEA